ncbi:hypothetical protein BK142_19315 [Paenibacillus glucanolyticus]|nr:hypothetical protein BK142_19315 [Paenibacillus glucanolyticus]
MAPNIRAIDLQRDMRLAGLPEKIAHILANRLSGEAIADGGGNLRPLLFLIRGNIRLVSGFCPIFKKICPYILVDKCAKAGSRRNVNSRCGKFTQECADDKCRVDNTIPIENLA